MLLIGLITTPDILNAMANCLDPRHLENLRMTCTQFSGSINAAVRAKSAQDALAKYAHAVLLPNGAFRLNSRFGRHTADIRAIPGMQPLMIEANHMNPTGQNPVVSMRLNGVTYMGRPWGGGGGGRDFMVTGETGRLFQSNETILQDLAGGVWISELNSNANFFGNGTMVHTTLRLTLDRGNTPNSPGQHQLLVVFTPGGW
jgi:hypothetical protein